MITYVKGNLLTVPQGSGTTVLVNTVNCVGVMGKGLALQFKQRFPGCMPGYQAACRTGKLQPGKLLWQRSTETGCYILQFPTKDDWRNPSRIEWIEWGLQQFLIDLPLRKITIAHFPMLGCGLGGLDWQRDVRPLMEAYLSSLSINIRIFTK